MRPLRALLALALALGEAPAVWAGATAPATAARTSAPSRRVVAPPVIAAPVVTANFSVSGFAVASSARSLIPGAVIAPLSNAAVTDSLGSQTIVEGSSARLTVWDRPLEAPAEPAQPVAPVTPVTETSSRGLSTQGVLRQVAEGGEAAAAAFDGLAPRSENQSQGTVSGSVSKWWTVTAAATLAPAQALAQGAAPVAVKTTGAGLGLSAVLSAPLLPLGYAYYELRRSKNDPKPEKAGALQRAAEWFEAGLLLPLSLGVAAGLSWLTQGTAAEPAAVAAALGLAAAGFENILGQARSRIVGGWQASHDMKMRVGPDGELRDVRGTHKRYGEDRYDKTAPGPVSPGERFFARALAAWGGLLWFRGFDNPEFWYYGAALTAVFVLSDVVRRRRKPFTPSAEDREHARRFNRD